jgi:rhamnose transport system ATP-binding protein
VARAVFGIDRRSSGEVSVLGKPLPNGSPLAAMAAGVALVPEDRRQQGLVMDLGIDRNTALASLGRLSRFGLIRTARERELAAAWARRLQLKFGRLRDAVSTLSGGNQQKVVLARWLAAGDPSLSVLIADEPTRGVDVGARAEIYGTLRDLADKGTAVLVITSDLAEAMALCDRLLVMREGRLVGELAGDDRTPERAASLMVPA